MNSGFLNRLVGTSIVVVAAIIFIPNILDGEKVHFKDGFKAIPERPEFTTIEIQQEIDAKAELAPAIKPVALHDEVALDAEPVSKEKVDSLEIKDVVNTAANDSGSQPIQVVEEAKPEVEEVKPQQQVVEAKVTPLQRSEASNLTSMAYVIQLGSFSHKANVEALMKKLKNAGFTAFTRPIKTRNGELTKVFVGPQLDKADLEQKLPDLEKLTKLKGRLTQFDITK
ncbi:DedD protein [Pseudoalteromonas phenolica]|uniref:SPOR domain-containing protein n=1 Tax=Pseudoalteromonas phenolica TaxID=161398 RepID=UPI00110A9EEA|nr:SPOR domain-containing protein [Pseudoalteromonas phenolica]TMN89516.1 DedD protein [Pseudoalteromonas phenolica]